MMAWMWIIAAGVLLGVEIMTADLLFASLAISALAAGLAGGLGANMVVQVIVFAVTAAITIGMLRPIALKHLRKQPANAATNMDALVGATAHTLELVSPTVGTAKLSGEVWTARTDKGEVPANTKVSVVRIDGAIAIVKVKGE
jgi:membrane protein implicated in regulation of membrane protease activity